ncbi:MAG: pectate lyase [Proteobacteria bacterium]|nr:pectate lyase [Pseudomonadota bacterium]
MSPKLPCFTLLGCALSISTAYALPAFPGAEGFGAEASGGRNGKVVFVTNLDDSGSGSLRSAVSGWGARTVVFRVGGEIQLKSPLSLSGSDITIAGQTAPGDGITLRGQPLIISGSNQIIRFIRIRHGNETGRDDDAISIVDGASRIIMDHVSASWSIDETLSPSGYIKDITLQWCMISESLNNSGHKKGSHGYGSLLRAAGGVSLHHNLWAHHRGRSPRFGDNYGKLFSPVPTFDFRNNVIYDWGSYASGTIDGDIRVNYVANYLKPGPSTSKLQPITFTRFADAKTRFFLANNVVEGHPEINEAAGNFTGPETGNPEPAITLASAPFTAPSLTTQTAADAYALVLAHAGASVPVRDAVDVRVIEQVKTGTGRLIDSQNEVGGWPKLASGTPPVDSDEDGIPDDWELAHGLNPKDGKDAATLSASGYTNLEVYLNELADRAITRLSGK